MVLFGDLDTGVLSRGVRTPYTGGYPMKKQLF